MVSSGGPSVSSISAVSIKYDSSHIAFVSSSTMVVVLVDRYGVVQWYSYHCCWGGTNDQVLLNAVVVD
jgi:hypothetical protein